MNLAERVTITLAPTKSASTIVDTDTREEIKNVTSIDVSIGDDGIVVMGLRIVPRSVVIEGRPTYSIDREAFDRIAADMGLKLVEADA